MQIFCVGFRKCIVLYLLLHIMCIITAEKSIPSNLPPKLEQINKGRGPVYTFVKTDKEANIKWGVHHYVPRTTEIKINKITS
ncbi:hypothetical protein KPH14_002462 [Odynerus spinipes]|uniref:Uncharacterized protein n=1 Tax=Odynerus spinipes TaxID=1348599 RepID=A0AAD9RS61_9HYME|nr:hypothetical protein KPH14_002462 [Odynerus spinipes]